MGARSWRTNRLPPRKETVSAEACARAFERAVAACNPEQLVERAKIEALGAYAGRPPLGVAIGKAALKMARGFGPVERGVIVTNADDGQGAPPGWNVLISTHPVPDERSLAAGAAVMHLVAGASKAEVVVALISGGASALAEWPENGVSLDEIRARVGALAGSGANIHAINKLRGQLSAIKAGKLARMSDAPVVTMAVSDVYDDDLAVIGSGPTIANRAGDRAVLVAPMAAFVERFVRWLPQHAGGSRVWQVSTAPLVGTIAEVMRPLLVRGAVRVRYGEPTVALPAEPGVGGRAQQLALTLARAIRGSAGSFAFIAGSDGIDGPPPPDRPAPAGAFVDGETWDRVIAAGIDPERALARCDAGPALAAGGALFVTGPTGINHGDVMVVG